MQKALCVTVDFLDDLLRAGRHFTEDDLDMMMKYAASLGATRCEWGLSTTTTLYDEDSPAGFDMLQAACEAAHRHGLRFDVFYKPYEGAMWMGERMLPNTFPCPDEAPVLEEPIGIIDSVRPYVLDHPEKRLARRADEAVDPGGRITAIRLIKNNDTPVPFGLEQLSIWTSARNGGFRKYRGPVSLKETAEWRPTFPYWDRKCRALTLEDLELPQDARFFLIRCKSAKERGEFTNAAGKLVELVNEDNQIIPSTPSRRRVNPESMYNRRMARDRLGLSRYMRLPEVRERLKDRDRFLKDCKGMFDYKRPSLEEEVALDQVGEIALMRGKLRHICGVPHPIYKEVRRHWLEEVQFCIDRGVDGVNIRVANHNNLSSCEQEYYGFNEPVIEKMTHPDNVAEARRVNGEAHTQFLREARELLHSHDKELGVHVHALMLRHDDRNPEHRRLPSNFDWQWKLWIRKLADYAEFRGAFMLRPESLRQVMDSIGIVCREVGIPFIYQSNRGSGPMHFEGPYPTLAREMAWVRKHPDIDVYNLYETANFTRINADDQFEGSTDMAELVRTNWWG